MRLFILSMLLACCPISAIATTQFKVTNYSVDKKQCGNTKGITASGHKVRRGVCAADWHHYPPGTIIKLDTKELLVVADTGNKVKGSHHIDRYNQNPKKLVYPITSRGIIVRRGDVNWRRKANGAYLAVKKSLLIRKNIIEGKIYDRRISEFKRRISGSSRTSYYAETKVLLQVYKGNRCKEISGLVGKR